MNKLLYKVVAGLIGAAATFAVQKSVSAGWSAATGQEPPNPNDPDVPASTAIIWTVASGLGLIVAQVLVTRFAARHFGSDVETQ